MMQSNLFRKVDKKTSNEQSRYKVFGLSRNPFPNVPGVNVNEPDNRKNGEIYYQGLRTAEEKKFEAIMIPTAQRPETRTVAFLMDYATRQGRGIGKTAFLNFQKNRLMKDLGADLSGNSEVMFAVYVSPMPDSYRKFSSISQIIIDSLVEQQIVSLALCRLRVFSGGIPEEIITSVGSQPISETIGSDEWLRDKGVNISNLNTDVRRMLTKAGIESEMVPRLADFGVTPDLFIKYYLKYKNDSYWKKHANTVLFNDFVKLFQLAEFTHGIILFDELEKVIVPQTTSSRREFCDSLRYFFFDGNNSVNAESKFFKLLLTIHPYLQELLNPHWSASGLERFAGLGSETSVDHTVFFNPIETTQAVPLTLQYLNESRLDANQKTNDISPFTEKALKAALDKTLKIPGNYLKFLNAILERAVDEGWDKIDVDSINSNEFTVNPNEDSLDQVKSLKESEVNLSDDTE